MPTNPEVGVDAELPSELMTAVLAVAGVQRLYATSPIVESVVRTVLGAITREQRRDELITVRAQNGAIEVSIRVGVAPDAAAPAVCRRVFDQVDELLSAKYAGVPTKITVAVGSVQRSRDFVAIL